MKLDIGHKHPTVSDWAMCGACGSNFQKWRSERREKEQSLQYKKDLFKQRTGIDAKLIKFMKPEMRKKFGQKYGPNNYAPNPLLKKIGQAYRHK